MKVSELVESKMDKMSESDFMGLATALATQFGLVLASANINIEGAEESLVPCLMEQDVVKVAPDVYVIKYDLSPAGIARLRAQLYGTAL